MPGSQPEGSMDSLQGRLRAFQNQVRAAARRSWFFSWYSWGFLFAGILGLGLGAVLASLFPVVTTTYTQTGSSTTVTTPFWVYPVSLFPSPVLLALAIREVVLGRREARTGVSRALPSRREAPSPPGAGWTELVRRSQQLITHMRSETVSGFIPLILGVYGAGGLLASVLLFPFLAVSFQAAILMVYVLPLPLLLLLIPFYLAVREWTRIYQDVLDWQVGSLSRLEQEFYVRFAGVSATT